MGNFMSAKDGKDDRTKDIEDIVKDAVKKVDEIAAKQKSITEKAEELAKDSKEQEKNTNQLKTFKEDIEAMLKEGPTRRHFYQENKQNDQRVCSQYTCTYYKQNEELNTALLKLKSENKEIASKVERIQNCMKTKEREFSHQISIKDEQLRRLTFEKDELEKKSKRSELENQRLRNQCEELEEKLRQKQRVQVLLFCAMQQKLLNEVSSNLSDLLTTQMDARGYNLQIDNCADPQVRPASLPLIVLCINASRLGTDVNQALQNVNCDHSVALVILHNKKIHTLPAQTSDRLLLGAEYKKLGLIVDIAYVSTDGMYPCNMNDNALTKLCQFIRNFS